MFAHETQPSPQRQTPAPPARVLRIAASALGGVIAVIAVVLGGIGWLWLLRQQGWFATGPTVPDALPLLQLANADGQALLRVVVAWLVAGLAAGICLRRIPRLWRLLFCGILAAALLWLASEESFALARNDTLGHVLQSRSVGSGPWLEAALLAVASMVPGSLRPRLPRPLVRRRQPGLSGG